MQLIMIKYFNRLTAQILDLFSYLISIYSDISYLLQITVTHEMLSKWQLWNRNRNIPKGSHNQSSQSTKMRLFSSPPLPSPSPALPRRLTWFSICRNCCSMGLQSAEMTGSLCRHTAAIRVHGELALSAASLRGKDARQTEALWNWRKPKFPTDVLLIQDRNCRKGRLAIRPQGAAIFVCCIQSTSKKIDKSKTN